MFIHICVSNTHKSTHKKDAIKHKHKRACTQLQSTNRQTCSAHVVEHSKAISLNDSKQGRRDETNNKVANPSQAFVRREISNPATPKAKEAGSEQLDGLGAVHQARIRFRKEDKICTPRSGFFTGTQQQRQTIEGQGQRGRSRNCWLNPGHCRRRHSELSATGIESWELEQPGT